MDDAPRILIADDEPTFLESTAELLRNEGYECTAVTDASQATEAIGRVAYDAVIADINMAGNYELELVTELTRSARGVPVILVTGYPSVQTAVAAIQLPVLAYLMKPFDFDDLLHEVQLAVHDHRVHLFAEREQRRAEEMRRNLNDIAQCSKQVKSFSSTPLTALLALTFRKTLDGVFDLERLTQSLLPHKEPQVATKLAENVLVRLQRDALVETMETLEKTKTAFKSKELGLLRRKLEQLLR
jgi:DNA-binding response OmpR family regulator